MHFTRLALLGGPRSWAAAVVDQRCAVALHPAVNHPLVADVKVEGVVRVGGSCGWRRRASSQANLAQVFDHPLARRQGARPANTALPRTPGWRTWMRRAGCRGPEGWAGLAGWGAFFGRFVMHAHLRIPTRLRGKPD